MLACSVGFAAASRIVTDDLSTPARVRNASASARWPCRTDSVTRLVVESTPQPVIAYGAELSRALNLSTVESSWRALNFTTSASAPAAWILPTDAASVVWMCAFPVAAS